MSNDQDRRSADHQLFRELFDEMQRLGDQVQRLVERMEAVALLAQRVETHHDEIAALRVNTESIRERLAHMEGRLPTRERENGGLSIKPGWLSAILVTIGFVLTGLWNLINWIIQLAKDRP